MTANHYLAFQIDDLLFAVPAEAVVQIIRAARLSKLPKAPEMMQGLLNVAGDMIPVIDIRKQLSRPGRPLAVTDRIIIVRVTEYLVAFIADQVHDVAELVLEPVEAAESIYPELDRYVTAVSCYLQKTIYIYNIEKLLPPREVEEIYNYLQHFVNKT